MYFWNVRALKTVLKERHLTDHESLPYYFGFALITEIVFFLISISAFVVPSGLDVLSGGIESVIALIGIFWAYRNNGGRYGISFLPRYFAIGWVVGIRLLAVFIPLALCQFAILEGVTALAIPISETVSDLVDLFSIAAIETIYCALVARYMAEVANAWPNDVPPPIGVQIAESP